jgi:hypothetical protein
MLRTMSPARRGSTTAPGCSTVADTGTRSDTSMSVAARPHQPSSARRRTWDRIWMVLLLDAARPAAASLAASSSLGDTRRTVRPYRLATTTGAVHRSRRHLDDVVN